MRSKRAWALLVLLPLFGLGPCGPIPGGELSGTVTPPPADWSFARKFRLCALEVRPDDPHSIVAYFHIDGADLYVAAERGPSKRWPKYVAEDPRVRIRFGDRIYELVAVRIDDPETILRLFSMRYFKRHGAEPPPNLRPPDDTYFYRLDRRS